MRNAIAEVALQFQGEFNRNTDKDDLFCLDYLVFFNWC